MEAVRAMSLLSVRGSRAMMELQWAQCHVLYCIWLDGEALSVTHSHTGSGERGGEEGQRWGRYANGPRGGDLTWEVK